MASVTKNDIPQIAKFMTTLWELTKKYYIPDNTDAYWDSFLAECEKAYKESKEDPYVLYVLMGLTTYLELKLDGKENRKRHKGMFE